MASQMKPGPSLLPAAGTARPVPHVSAPQVSRLWFIDNLRVVLICGVVVAHLTLTYGAFGGGFGPYSYYHDPAQLDMLTSTEDVLLYLSDGEDQLILSSETQRGDEYPMPYLLVRHKVEEYAKWKALFDEQAASRQDGGSRGGQLFRNVNDPNELVILFAWDDLQHASQFVQSEELRQVMQQAGVVDLPEIYFLEAVEHVPA